jgi:G:T/U-mismatch repair DNA glycosylase
MEGVLNEKDLEEKAKNDGGYYEAMSVLKKHGIALLDLYESCDRVDKNGKNTSLDKNIKNAKINEELANIPQTVKVLCNGAKAYRGYEKTRKTLLPKSEKLPSSANSYSRMNVQEKIAEWKKYF